jgi:hypothetical protein
MVNILKEAKKILNELGYNDIKIMIKNERLRFASANYAKKGIGPTTGKEHPDIIKIFGNEPSLIRLGIAYLLVHELSHHNYRLDNKSHPDEDHFTEFKEIEWDLREQLFEIVLSEDG